MTATLNTVSDYIADARVLLQDTIPDYRYDDASLLTALNLSFMDGRRLRPDLFIASAWDPPTSFTAVSSTVVPMEHQFRMAFVFGACAHALARDQEDVQDERSVAFSAVYNAVLTGTTMPGITPRRRDK